MPGPRQHVIGYGRVSTEEQESNYSMDAQRSRFETLAKQNHWHSLGFFPETGSGTSVINRPVLCNILQRIQQGGVHALWVKETDRLSRPENLGDLSLISQTLESSSTLLMVDTRSLDLREDNSRPDARFRRRAREALPQAAATEHEPRESPESGDGSQGWWR